MIILQHSPTDTVAKEVTERLTALSLAHKLEETITDTLILTEGKATYEGYEAIMAYLDKLDGERKQWYYCNC